MKWGAVLLVSALVLASAGAGAAQPAADWSAAELVAVRRAASQGQKAAQLELGKRYEAGSGVPRDLRQARRLYAQAARDTVSRQFAYSGPIGSERRGRAQEVGRPRVTPGLPEAAARLDALNGSAPVKPPGAVTGPAESQPAGVVAALVDRARNAPARTLLSKMTLSFPDGEPSMAAAPGTATKVWLSGLKGVVSVRPDAACGAEGGCDAYTFVADIPVSRCVPIERAEKALIQWGWSRKPDGETSGASGNLFLPPITNVYGDGQGDFVELGPNIKNSCVTRIIAKIISR